eukprot:COSAG01_NODE_5569_length_4176_cov_7.015943_3_plen_58_part_00
MSHMYSSYIYATKRVQGKGKRGNNRNLLSRASEVIRMARGRLRGELAMPDGELGTDS